MMKLQQLTTLPILCLLAARAFAVPSADDITRPIAPGEPGARPFWNQNAYRFIYAPAFDFPTVQTAASYRFSLKSGDGKTRSFDADKPTAPLSPVWEELPEGVTTLAVEAIDTQGNVVGQSGTRTFYVSPGFAGETKEPARPYNEAARRGLRAIFLAPHVQHWLERGERDPSYSRYVYPNKVMGAVARAMVSYSQSADDRAEREAALKIARTIGNHLISIRYAGDAKWAGVAPTYSMDVDKPLRVVKERHPRRWLMTPSVVDAALAFLDLYDATTDQKYFDAACGIADALVRNQESDGTWPLMVDWQTGKPVAPQRLIPTWNIFLFDRLDRQYGISKYRPARAAAWKWIEQNPLQTYQWDAQFEDVKPRKPYINLAREQACDVAELILSEPDLTPERIEQAIDLLRFSEDQFAVWDTVMDPIGWERVMPKRRKNVEYWITPGIMEQYVCYDPVARSSAIIINAYLKAYEVTKDGTYLAKARAMGNGLVDGQIWFENTHAGNGEIPTWLRRIDPRNWLNNSYYAADALRKLSQAEDSKTRGQ